MTTNNPASQPADVEGAPNEPVELWPGVPERIYLHRDSQGLWRRTAFGSLPDTIVYIPETRTSPADIAERARRAAEAVVPDCLSRTCFIKGCGYDHCWGCDDSKAERQRVAAIITAEFGGGAGEGTKE